MINRRLYAVHYYPDPLGYSKKVGSKGRLLPGFAARKVVVRLRKLGVDAEMAPVKCRLTEKSALALNEFFAKKYGRIK